MTAWRAIFTRGTLGLHFPSRTIFARAARRLSHKAAARCGKSPTFDVAGTSSAIGEPRH